jgi:putative tryptophan/tyrosine transport system substrate-binding protein
MTAFIGRRDFITLLSGAAAWPLSARAQQTGKLPTVGFLVPGTPATHGQWFAALAHRLRDFGWIDGRNITVEYRRAEGRPERFAAIAAEFVRLKVDVIATSATGPTLAANQATRSIPIVFAGVADAVGSEVRPGMRRPECEAA